MSIDGNNTWAYLSKAIMSTAGCGQSPRVCIMKNDQEYMDLESWSADRQGRQMIRSSALVHVRVN